jgi:hypothetical protein
MMKIDVGKREIWIGLMGITGTKWDKEKGRAV